ncbi:MAG: hypothetical protein KatS3mg009_3407 [Acidimicrobiia bacterium]|nr:MAG: hypothetical protein KatS3mg009_3407 [Acidimicrobiia bacterium]
MPEQQLAAMMDPSMDRGDLARAIMAAAGDPRTGLHGYATWPVDERTWMLQLFPTNVGVFETDEGVVLVDTGCPGDATTLLHAVRELTSAPLHTVVYTHGHLDHAFGLRKLLEDGERPRIIAHENTPARFERYMRTAGYNARINSVQFQQDVERIWWPRTREDFDWPTETYRDRLELEIGGESFVLHHGKGETDDATWVVVPGRSVLACGDFWFGVAPNCGNPQKVQRYPVEWAAVAEEMAAVGAEHLFPGHNAYQRGADDIRRLFLDQAAYLGAIIEQTFEALNACLPHDEIVAAVSVPESLRDNVFLQPVYDRPEFIARNLIRRYGGWWSGYASELLPATMREQAEFVAGLAGGPAALAGRAAQLAADGELVLACHAAEWALLAGPDDAEARRVAADVFEQRARGEPSLMARSIFRALARSAGA